MGSYVNKTLAASLTNRLPAKESKNETTYLK